MEIHNKNRLRLRCAGTEGLKPFNHGLFRLSTTGCVRPVRDLHPNSPNVCYAAHSCPPNIRLLRYLQCIINLNPEISHRAFKLGMSWQQMDGASIFGAAVDQRGLGAVAWRIAVSRYEVTNARGWETGTVQA